MQITEILERAGGIQSMARELGVSEADAARGAAALAPAILAGFSKQAGSQPAGLEGLGGAPGAAVLAARLGVGVGLVGTADDETRDE